MKKICYVVTISLTLKSFFVSQLKYLADNGYDITVICSPDNELAEMLGNNIEYIPVAIPRGISIFGMLQATHRLKAIFKSSHYDMVQYSTPNASLCASIAAKTASINIRNYHLMGLRYLGDKGLKKFILKFFEKITCKLSTNIECVSKSNLDLGVKEKLFSRDKAVVVFNGSTGGIDLARFCAAKRNEYRNAIRTKYNLDNDDFVFGFVGRITKDKGVDEILKAFFQTTSCKLMMIGFNDNTDSLDQDLYKKSLSDSSIVYTGPVYDVEKYYAAIDCLLLPSYREGFGNVIIEAAAMGCPAIVSDIPGPIDASIKNKTAFWIEPRNVEQLILAMNRMKTEAANMQDYCIKYATENFDQNKLNIAIKNRKDFLLHK